MRGKNEVSHLLGSVHNGSEVLLAVVESYKQADTSETRCQLLSLVANKVIYVDLVAHIPRLTGYEFTAARPYTLQVGAGFTVQSVRAYHKVVKIHAIGKQRKSRHT